MNEKSLYLELIQSVNSRESYIRVKKQIPNLLWDKEKKRGYVKVDLPKLISDRIAEYQVSRRQVAAAIGYNYSNFVAYLNGRVSMPRDKIAEALAVLNIL